MKKTLLLVVGIILLAGCANSLQGPGKSGFLGEYAEKMTPGPEGKAKMGWLKPGADLTKYNKFMVEYVIFTLAEDSEYKGIDGDEMKKLGDAATLALANTISEKYTVVTEPGPDVLRFKSAIVGLKQSNPYLSGLSVISLVNPVGLGVNIVKKGTTGSWSGSGATQAEFMLLDSMTNEVIAVGYDEYSAGFSERFSKWGSAEEAFKFWGKRGMEDWEEVRSKSVK
jgi:hypothetical protein